MVMIETESFELQSLEMQITQVYCSITSYNHFYIRLFVTMFF